MLKRNRLNLWQKPFPFFAFERGFEVELVLSQHLSQVGDHECAFCDESEDRPANDDVKVVFDERY